MALHYYTLLGLGIANTDTRPDLVAARQQILPVIRAWRKASSASTFGELGADFAQVTRVYIQTVTELARLLARRAGANSDDSDLTAVSHRGGTRADRRWGDGAWRNRLHNLLYGGDPLGTGFGPDGDESFNSLWGTYGGYATKPYVSTEVDEPEVNVLLGLARAADSLYLQPGRFIEGVADFIYRDVEAWLLEQQCLRDDPLATCDFTVASTEVASLAAFEDSLLWKTLRVTPDHARKLASILVEAAPTVGNDSGSFAVDQHGAFHLVGQNEQVDAPPGVAPVAGVYWDHIDPQFSMVPFDNATYGSAFGTLVGTAIPSTLYLYQPGTTQGFVARRGNGEPGGSNLDLRYTGAVSVLAAVRDGLLTGREWAANTGSATAQAYFKQSEAMLGAITATAGETSVAVKPYKIPLTIQGACAEFGGVSPCVGLAQLYLGGGNGTELLVNEVSVVVPQGTAPADLVVLNTDVDASLTGVQTSAALFQGFSSFDGYTRADLDAEPATAPTVQAFANSGGTYDRWVYLVGWPRTPNNGQVRLQEPTLLLRTRGSGGSQYLILADRLAVQSQRTSEQIVVGAQIFDTYRSSKGRYLAFGGTLGDIAQRSRLVLRDDWSVPALDGFGLPVGWVPPTSPELTGISAGDTAVNYYLRTSKVAADEATRAVEGAVENLIAEEGDQQVLSAAEQKGDEVPELEKRAICGQAKDCVVPAITAFVPAPVITCSSAFCDQADAFLDNQLPKQVVTSVPLLEVLDAQSPPTFPEFAGGAIQGALIREWTGHSALNNYIRSIGSQVEAIDLKVVVAKAQLAAARASSDAARKRVGRECSESGFKNAVEAGYSVAGTESVEVSGFVHNDDGYVTSAKVVTEGQGKSWNAGPFYAQIASCKEAQLNLPQSAALEYAQDRQSAASMAEAMAWLGAQAGTVDQLVGDAAGARAEVSRLLVQGKNAARVAELDGALATAGRTRTFGTYRRLHQYDLWRARALLENARRLAATARRAIESQYVVNLSTLVQDEPFVSSPESWADEVYDFDLDAPSAVGLSSVPTRNAGIYPNKLLDYVSNLEAFVQGYSVARPSTVAQRDAEIFSLTGPDTLQQIDVDVGGEPQVLNVLDPDSQGWQFYCPDSDSWATHPSVGEVPASFSATSSCGDGKRPTMARRLFHLDPWGRLSGLTSNPPYQARYNARWKRLAVNLVGTGIRDCSRADDPLTCYSESFIRYDLRHVGPSWVTDYNQHWRWLGIGSARIEAGKAITAEEWLDPLVNGWSQAFVSEAARTEFMDRPLDGDYGLTLHLTPDIRMERIDRIQILLETSYWVGSE